MQHQYHRVGNATVISLAALAAAGLLAGCAQGDPVSTQTSATVSTSASVAAPTPSPSNTAAGASPFSGRAGGAGKPVLVVKFDNTPNAQPHVGLQAADIVFVEEVEFGLTRLAAVFSTEIPKVVGPIRSARISDIDLLGQFGRPAFSYSGAQAKLRPVLASASLVDVSGDQGPQGYFRDKARRAPYNFMGYATNLLARAPDASPARDIGYLFSVQAPLGGKKITTATVKYPSSLVQFLWNAAGTNYDVWLNGKRARAAEGGTQHAATVVIEYVDQHASGYGDKFGGLTPKEETIGKGTGWILRDGQAWPVTWNRPTLTVGTTYTGADGKIVNFAPGQIWVVLINKTTPAKLV